MTVGAAACGACHLDTVNATTGSAPENVLPSFYPLARGGAGLDPCDGSEEAFPSESVSLDNDGDGLTDGDDPDCQPPPEICDNGVDDNDDGLVDCADPQCDGFVGDPTTCGVGECAAAGNLVCRAGGQVDTCEPGDPMAEAAGTAACEDGLDNDCDGLTDGEDPDCVIPPETDCADGIDNDGDGAIDCADLDCEGVVVGGPTACGVGECAAAGELVCQGGAQVDTCTPGAPGTEGPAGDPTCTDRLDNDCNGLTDENDPACIVGEEICDNGVDDNANGLVDCADSMCDGFRDGECVTGLPGICGPGTFICQNGAQVCEQNEPAGQEGPFGNPTCADGLDNDCNGLADAADPNCQEPVAEICDDGIDNNGDGLVDCADPMCDGFRDGECVTGLPGICAVGTFVCRDQQQFCDQTVQPQAEGPAGAPTCSDGLDNDCDGLTDMEDPDCQVAAKVTICHIPPGNPAKARTLSIHAESVADHLRHGDSLGACQ